MDLLGYVEAYGNFSFQEKPINEVDSLLFSTLCYENLDHVLLHPMTLKKASDIFFELYDIETLKKRISLTKRSYELLKEMAKWPRYQDLVLSGFEYSPAFKPYKPATKSPSNLEHENMGIISSLVLSPKYLIRAVSKSIPFNKSW